jgi:phosphoglycolate phosphatase-like HAD superfamily hydrolase
VEKGALPGAAAILDVDGTLVDSNYHHALAWFRAFRGHGLIVPLWRIHRHIGMGGDQLVPAVAGDEFERESGEAVREAHGREFTTMIDEVAPLEGARDLILELKRRGQRVVLASSAAAEEVDRYLDLLEAGDIVDGWTTSADVDATKPEPDLVEAAMNLVDGGGGAVMVGDTPWDVLAATAAGIACVTLLTGGFAEQELRDAGAAGVFESIPELIAGIEPTPLGARNDAGGSPPSRRAATG